jgi:hypothetical protein
MNKYLLHFIFLNCVFVFIFLVASLYNADDIKVTGSGGMNILYFRNDGGIVTGKHARDRAGSDQSDNKFHVTSLSNLQYGSIRPFNIRFTIINLLRNITANFYDWQTCCTYQVYDGAIDTGVGIGFKSIHVIEKPASQTKFQYSLKNQKNEKVVETEIIEGPFTEGTEIFISFIGTVGYNADQTPINIDKPRVVVYQQKLIANLNQKNNDQNSLQPSTY